METKISKPRYSVIVPVYNRNDEVADLLTSLATQSRPDLFEVILVEDGSTLPCTEAVERCG